MSVVLTTKILKNDAKRLLLSDSTLKFKKKKKKKKKNHINLKAVSMQNTDLLDFCLNLTLKFMEILYHLSLTVMLPKRMNQSGMLSFPLSSLLYLLLSFLLLTSICTSLLHSLKKICQKQLLNHTVRTPDILQCQY